MLRPSNSILGSSRAARRATVHAEVVRMTGTLARGVIALSSDLFGSAYDLLLLAVLPPLYVGGAYLALDLPLRWLTRREALSLPGAGKFVAAALISAVGIVRAVRRREPIAPVSSRFARTLLCVGWAAALLLAWADVVS